MHKFITVFFSSILTAAHIAVFAILAYLVYVGADLSIMPDASPVQNFLLIVGLAIVYTLFAGITSVIIRMNQNLERIAKHLGDWQDVETEFEQNLDSVN